METEVVQDTPKPAETAGAGFKENTAVALPKGEPTPEYIAQMNELGAKAKAEQAPEGEPAKDMPPAPKTEDKPIIEAKPEKVVEIVEKVVEKYPELDENQKWLFDAIQNGKEDDVYDYMSKKRKNYDTMSHVDLIRENLAKKNPQWGEKDIELEIRAVYGEQIEKYDLDNFDKENDPQGYKEAVEHNRKADENQIRLERDARDARLALKEGQKTIELPKIKEAEPVVQSHAPTAEEIEAAQRGWAEAAEQQVTKVEAFTFEVGDKEHPEKVEFAITPEDKTKLVESMKGWTGDDFMKRRGWRNEDGTFNLANIARDERMLENISSIVKSAYTDGFRNGGKKVIAEDIKNVDFEQNHNNNIPVKPKSVGSLLWG